MKHAQPKAVRTRSTALTKVERDVVSLPPKTALKRARTTQFDVLTGTVKYRNRAMARGSKRLPDVVKVWEKGLEATMTAPDPDNPEFRIVVPDWDVNLKCADALADRCGLPKTAKSELTGAEGVPLTQQLTDEQIDTRLAYLLAKYGAPDGIGAMSEAMGHDGD